MTRLSQQIMPIKDTSTLSSEKSAEEVLGDLDNYLEQAVDHDQQSLYSTSSARTASYKNQLKKICAVCKETASPLISAVESNHKGCLHDILDSLAYLDVSEEKDKNGDTAAHLAAEHGRIELLKLMCSHDRTVLEAKDHKGASPLHTSAYHGQLGCTRWILQHGGSVFQKDFDGATPAHYAAMSGHLECLEELIPAHSRLANEQTYSGETPVYFAAQEGKLKCLRWLIQHGDGDPGVAANDGMLPIHAATQSGHFAATEWLVTTAKCRVDSKTLDGGTVVHFAAAKGHVDILEWLFQHSLATGMERDDFDTTPVHDAAEEGQIDCLKVFHEHKVNLCCKDTDGFTPKDLAAQNSHSACVLFLENPSEFFKPTAAVGELQSRSKTSLHSFSDEEASPVNNHHHQPKKSKWTIFKKANKQK